MIRRYRIGDALKVDVQYEQVDEAKEYGVFFDEIIAYSMVDDDGIILAVIGYKIIEDRAECFALLGKNIGNKMIELVRFIQNKIKNDAIKWGINRILITVKDGFINAGRMANMLGFMKMAKLPSFFNGNDYFLYEKRS